MSSSDSSFSVKPCQRARSAKPQRGEGRQHTLLLGLLLGGLSGATGANVQQKLLDVLALKRLFARQNYRRIPNPSLLRAAYLGEQRRPDGLDIGDLGGGDQSLELVGLRCGLAMGGRAGGGERRLTVISMPSSARMRAA